MSRPTKIISVIPDLRKGGAERLALNIQAFLQNQPDIEAHLIVFRDNNDYQFLSEHLNVHVIKSQVTPSISGKSTIEVNELQTFIDDFQPDIVHSHLFESEIVLSQLKLNPEVQRMVHVHDNMPQLKKGIRFSKASVTNRFERSLVLNHLKKHRAKFVCISKDTFEYIGQNVPNWHRKKLINNAIDLNRFSAKPKVVKSQDLVMIGSLVDKKGHQLAINVAKELKHLRHQFHLNILGNGPLKNVLVNHIQQLDLQNQVTLHGAVDHPEGFLQQSKYFLHTAKYEPFGLVLIEAMATGTPVISTDGVGNRDIMNGKNGLFIKHRDAKKIAQAIVDLDKNEALQNNYAEEGLKTAQKHGMEQYGKKLLEFYAD